MSDVASSVLLAKSPNQRGLISDHHGPISSHRFLLDNPSQAWFIVAGPVDLYLVDLEGSVPCSSLDYIGSLEPGSL